jgi:uncharacterized membrane protein YhaH (DUF805 family)
LRIFVVFSTIAVGIERLREREKSGWRGFRFIVLPVLLPQARAPHDNAKLGNNVTVGRYGGHDVAR